VCSHFPAYFTHSPLSATIAVFAIQCVTVFFYSMLARIN